MLNPTITPGAAHAAPAKTCGHEGARPFGSSQTLMCRACVRELRRLVEAMADDPNITIEAGGDMLRDWLTRRLGGTQ